MSTNEYYCLDQKSDSNRNTFSILMPAFEPNAKLAGKAFASVLPQFIAGDELIVQDGGSDQRWHTAAQGRSGAVRFFVESDEGQADALNRALARAKGDWIGWLNADDIYYEGALESVRQAATTHPRANVIVGAYTTIDGNSHVRRTFPPPEPTFDRLAMRGCMVYSGAFFIKRSHLLALGGFSRAYHFCMDYELYLRTWGHSDTCSSTVPEILGALRIHEGTKTTSTPWRFVKEARAARQASIYSPLLRGISEVETAKHALTVATTSLRETAAYRRWRVGRAGTK
ncbi:glycosyltransferase [Zafaria cholistanensis]|uniref:glycosyltransferase n=1 Tax=Zafaria cholistanensis TaxID=1682741 RepID=UPI0012302A99|nr:glycosyltransferase [Zafaria cholistanensis]